MLGLALALGQSPCDEPIAADTVSERTRRAEAAVAALDSATFIVESEWLAEAIPCVAEVLSPKDAASVHRVQALVARIERRDEEVRMAFAASRASDPTSALSEDLAPLGSPLRDAFVAIPLSVGRSESLQEPASGQLWFDGSISSDRQLGWPTVYQRTNDDGKVVESHYLWPQDPMPSYPLPDLTTRRNPTAGLAIAGGGLVVAALGVMMVVDAEEQRQEWCVEKTCSEGYWRELSWRFPMGGTLIALGAAAIPTGLVVAVGPRRGVSVSGQF